MKIFFQRLYTFFPLLTVLALATALRVIYLDRVPTGITGDELLYVLQAKAIALTGKDISGNWNPLTSFLFQYPPEEHQAELPYLLLTPVVGLTHFSLFNARITYALLSVGVVFFIFQIAAFLFGKKAGFIAGIIAALNPWFIFIGRTNYEAGSAMFFYLLTFYFILILRGWSLLVVLPIASLAFYSYIGTKIIFLPFIILSLLFAYSFKENHKYRLQYIVIALFSVLFLLFFYIVLKTETDSGVSRMNEFFTWKTPQIIKETNDLRHMTITTSITYPLINKFTIYIQAIFTKFFQIFSTQYLFLFGDQFISLWKHGVFYLIDFFLIIFGFVSLFAYKRKIFFFLIGFIILATFPQLFHQTKENFTPHFTLIFPFIILIMAYGISYVISTIKNRIILFCISVASISVYSVFVLYFSVIYFLFYPLRGYSDFQIRLMTRYVHFAQNENRTITLYTVRDTDVFKKYIFYSDAFNSASVNAVKTALRTNHYTIGNVAIRPCLDSIKPDLQPDNTSDITVYDIECGKLPDATKRRVNIARISDGGQLYTIYNDTLCSQWELKHFPSDVQLKYLAIEKLSPQFFCQMYITN